MAQPLEGVAVGVERERGVGDGAGALDEDLVARGRARTRGAVRLHDREQLRVLPLERGPAEVLPVVPHLEGELLLAGVVADELEELQLLALLDGAGVLVEAEQAPLADEDGDAACDELVVDAVEVVDHVLADLVVEGGVTGDVHAERPEPVVVHGGGQVRVVERGDGVGQGVEALLLGVGVQRRQDQDAVGVAAARVAHDLVEGHVELVQQDVGGGVVDVVELRLVDALEQQLRRGVAEAVGQVGPDGVVAGEDLVVVRLHVRGPDPRVVVDVDEHVQVFGQSPADHLLDAVEVCRVDGVVGRRALVVVPRDRDADAVEALVGDVRDELLGDARVAPGGLVLADGVERVAEVPAGLHRGDGRHRVRVAAGRRGGRGRLGGLPDAAVAGDAVEGEVGRRGVVRARPGAVEAEGDR